jgi:3-methyladenine DNA glycosylase/8-oxoguanine DNA glycosylase
MLALEGSALFKPVTIDTPQELRQAVKRLTRQDPKLALCLKRPLPWRFRPEASPYASLMEAVVHQQLSLKAATTIFDRLTMLFGGSVPEPNELIKTPDTKLRGVGLSTAKTASLKDLAARTLDGTVPSAEKIVLLDDDHITQRLTSIRGIGRWTVEMLLIFTLRRRDVFPVDDYAIRRSLSLVYGLKEVPSAKEVTPLGESWRPYRTVASLALWNHLSSTEDQKILTARRT